VKRIFVPANTLQDWRQFLADPAKHWKIGYSARTLANCWHVADGFPSEINHIFSSSTITAFQSIEPLLILPEYKVALSGAGKDSQNDIFVLAKTQTHELASIMVEGKVDESFGNTLKSWKLANQGFTDNKRKRLDYIQQQLGLENIPDDIYYQLLHRTASARIEAERFNASYALMIVHSFSQTSKWFGEYARFLALFGITAEKNNLYHLNTQHGIHLYSLWADGDKRFLEL
jgi:hypothetical protein